MAVSRPCSVAAAQSIWPAGGRRRWSVKLIDHVQHHSEPPRIGTTAAAIAHDQFRARNPCTTCSTCRAVARSCSAVRAFVDRQPSGPYPLSLPFSLPHSRAAGVNAMQNQPSRVHAPGAQPSAPPKQARKPRGESNTWGEKEWEEWYSYVAAMHKMPEDPSPDGPIAWRTRFGPSSWSCQNYKCLLQNGHSFFNN